MRVVSVVGARPQFVKLAPIAREFQHRRIEHLVIHTGQHYDARMSGGFFEDFDLAEPDVNLEVGSGGHGAQTGTMLKRIEPHLEELRPDWVLVYGDTNSTLAGTLASVKLEIPVAHLEAGLRSFNRSMPEEHNRVLTDHAADLLLAPTQTAAQHLAREGLADRTVVVGDVMVDICLAIADQNPQSLRQVAKLADQEYVLATLHRPYNTDNPERLERIIAEFAASPIPVLLPSHPRLERCASAAGTALTQGNLISCPPMRYTEMITALLRARAVVTDSGGLQKESYVLGIPCTTVRSETEWEETLADGWNVLRFEPVTEIMATALRPVPGGNRRPYFGDGDAAAQVATALVTFA